MYTNEHMMHVPGHSTMICKRLWKY